MFRSCPSGRVDHLSTRTFSVRTWSDSVYCGRGARAGRARSARACGGASGARTSGGARRTRSASGARASSLLPPCRKREHQEHGEGC